GSAHRVRGRALRHLLSGARIAGARPRVQPDHRRMDHGRRRASHQPRASSRRSPAAGQRGARAGRHRPHLGTDRPRPVPRHGLRACAIPSLPDGPHAPAGSGPVVGGRRQGGGEQRPIRASARPASHGADLSSEWFPILPPKQQSPYDIGPYAKPTIAPIETMSEVTDAKAQSAAALYQRLAALPPGLVAKGGASNNWAVGGAKTTSGGALLAGDPHLHLTLPAIW